MQEISGRRLHYLENSNETIIGVYKIENIKNHKVYIGSSKNIYMRWKQHIAQLKQGTHHSVKLQRCYDKLKNKTTLQFSIVEIVKDVNKLKEREQYYIDKYDAFNTGYNCSKLVDNPKYTLKNKITVKHNKLAKQLYSEFNDIYDEKIFKFPRQIYDRIEGKQYKLNGIEKIVWLMKLYLKYFKNLPLTCRIYLDKQFAYMEIYQGEKEDYITYKFDHYKAIAYFPVSKSDIKLMEARKNYKRLLHTLLKRFPVLTLN